MPTLNSNKQLAQRTPTTTAANVIYKTPNQNTAGFIKTIIVCNTTAAAVTYSLYVNQGGSATGDTFALIRSSSIAANATDQLTYPADCAIIINGDYLFPNATVSVASSVGSALTFTLYGYEVVQT